MAPIWCLWGIPILRVMIYIFNSLFSRSNFSLKCSKLLRRREMRIKILIKPGWWTTKSTQRNHGEIPQNIPTHPMTDHWKFPWVGPSTAKISKGIWGWGGLLFPESRFPAAFLDESQVRITRAVKISSQDFEPRTDWLQGFTLFTTK